MDKKLTVKSILWFCVAFGATIGVLRMARGLGATTALSDFDPWGFWIGFDVMAGVALAAGGFTLAAIVYIFHLERLRPVVRPAVVTAFLGYVIVAIGLMFDLGIPWNIWHPMIYWQYHSVLFEVGTCVILYLNVLAIEVAPIVLEHPLFSHPIFHKIYKFLKFFTIPTVILGIMLSTLHQSSLGSLFLIIPFRVEPLWYSHILYVLYFISAVGLGCAMVIVEASITGYVYDHKPRLDIFQTLGRICSVVLGIYLVVRLGDLAHRGVLTQVFNGTWKTNLFIIEIIILALAPIILFNLPKVRQNATYLFYTALMVVVGFIMNRQDVLLTMERKGRALYFPSIAELGISVMLVAGAALVLFFFVENFDLFSHGHKTADPEKQGFKPGYLFFWELKSLKRSFVPLSAAVVFGVGAAFALLPSSAVHGYKYPRIPAANAVGWDTLRVDGNRGNEYVMFPHELHKQKIGLERDSCMVCHHMNLPGDGPSSCNECHSDMYQTTSIFDHNYHELILGATRSCDSCHAHGSKAKEDALACNSAGCHKGLLESDTSSYMAISYMDAMHTQCRECHEKEAAKADSLKKLVELSASDTTMELLNINIDSVTALGYCNACHPGMADEEDVVLRIGPFSY